MIQTQSTQCQATAPRFTFLTADDLAKIPEPPWLIDDILPAAGLGSIYGPSGVGKSFLCLDLAASIATGKDWFGRKVSQSNVLYIALEGKTGLYRRIQAWQQHHEITFPNNVFFIHSPFSLKETNDPYCLAGLITSSEDIGLIIIDTLNRAAPGTDENSSSDMGKVIAGIEILQRMTSASILVVHHSGKDVSRGLRGHSSLHAALDCIIELERGEDRHVWRLVKSKDGEDGISHAFQLQKIELGVSSAGKNLTSCVAVACEGSDFSLKQASPKGANQKIILNGFSDLALEKRMEAAAFGNNCPEGITIDEAIERLKSKLEKVDASHQKIRTKEALSKLVQSGHLICNGDLLTENRPTRATEGAA